MRPLRAALIDFAPIVAGSLVRVREQIVSGGDRFETSLRLRLPRVEIRVELLGELAVGLADLVGTGVRLDAEHLIGRLRRHSGLTLPQALALGGSRSLLDANGDV